MLRGINVGGQKSVPMAELKKLYESLRFKNVQTYIQSGNVIFQSSESDVSKLITKIEKKIKQVFGFDVPVVIRTKEELQKAIKKMPFTNKETDGVYMMFLSDKPGQIPLDEINKVKDKSETFYISGKEIYLSCPKGFGQTKLTINLFEKKLKITATARNWNTVNKLMELAD